MGPYKFMGKFMEQSETICWTNHHSFIELDGQWYLFYHHNDYSPYFDKNRSVCVDYVNFNEDGTIQMVTPTLRGVGVTPASRNIQIDRYSNKSEKYVAVDFLNPTNTFDGWRAILWNTTQEREPLWISYDRVDFEQGAQKTATIRVHSLAGGKIELRADSLEGPVLASFDVPGKANWCEQTVLVNETVKGVHDLYLLMTNGNHVEVDWVTFK